MKTDRQSSIQGARIPAAQYLRMSTKNQPHSIENQAAAIAEYARKNNFVVTHTYIDPGRSGLLLRNRPGLQSLLREVTQNPRFHAVLVYDVSRFGRFQNLDEAAHYEFLCRSSGVPVHYCAEPFSSESKPANAILKTLKRYMAAEYSRQLRENMLLSRRLNFEKGYQLGGSTPFGMRRMTISCDRKRGRILERGEKKPSPADHVIFVPGPANEVALVRHVFRMACSGAFSYADIARDLNRDGMRSPRGGRWLSNGIRYMVNNPVYAGFSVLRKHVSFLEKAPQKIAREDWNLLPNRVEAIIDLSTFNAAAPRACSAHHWNRESAVQALQRLRQQRGRITEKLLDCTQGAPCRATLIRIFGSYSEALKAGGISVPRTHTWGSRIRESLKLKADIADQLLDLFPSRLKKVANPTLNKHCVLLDDEYPIAILMARPIRPYRQTFWIITPPRRLRNVPALCCLRKTDFTGIEAMYIVPRLPPATLNIQFAAEGNPSYGGTRLHRLQDFCEAVVSVLQNN